MDYKSCKCNMKVKSGKNIEVNELNEKHEFRLMRMFTDTLANWDSQTDLIDGFTSIWAFSLVGAWKIYKSTK